MRAAGWTHAAISTAVATDTSGRPGRYVNASRSSKRMNDHTRNPPAATVAASSIHGRIGRSSPIAKGRHTSASAAPIRSPNARVSVP
jgi:hypothetical protein